MCFHTALTLPSVFLCVTHSLSLSLPSLPSHFLKSVENPRLAVQSSCKTLGSASLDGWPHKLSRESSFLAKAQVRVQGKECKKKRRDLLCDYQRVEVDGDSEVWTRRGWGEHRLANPSNRVESSFLLSAPTAELTEKVCHWAISLHINFLSSRSLDTRVQAEWLLFWLCFFLLH